MNRLEGKVALVTGAARGQGRAEALRLAEDGADVIALDVCRPIQGVRYFGATPEDLEAVADGIVALGRRVESRQIDVRSLSDLVETVTACVDLLGSLDIVVANAGIVSYGRLWELEEDQFRSVMDTKVTGTWNTIKACVPIMIRQGTGGSVIITSSVAGLKGLPFLGHYVASKHAVTGMAKSLANELGEFNIRVNTVHPHGVNTAMGLDDTLEELIEVFPHLRSNFSAILPTGMVEPSDIASVVAFLASDEGRFITGSQIPVDLGALAR